MSIDQIFQLGDDALQNLFDVIIPPFPGALDPISVNFRVQNFTIPATGVETYEIHYKTQKATKPSGKITMPNEFSFDFRADKYWLIYNGFKNWKNIVAHTKLGTMTEDVRIGQIRSNIRVPITIISTDANGIPTGGRWIFEGSFIQELGEVGFDYTVGDPVTVSITMGFLVLNDTFPLT